MYQIVHKCYAHSLREQIEYLATTFYINLGKIKVFRKIMFLLNPGCDMSAWSEDKSAGRFELYVRNIV